MKAIYAEDIKPGDMIRTHGETQPAAITVVEPSEWDPYKVRKTITIRTADGRVAVLATNMVVGLTHRPWAKDENEQYWRNLIGSRVCDMNEARRYYPNDLAALRTTYVRLREALEGYALGVPDATPRNAGT